MGISRQLGSEPVRGCVMRFGKGIKAQTELSAAVATLQRIRIHFRGPFGVPSGFMFFIFGDCIVTVEEVLKLYSDGELDEDHIEWLLLSIVTGREISPLRADNIN